ncbi:MAG: MoaD/ThiS family protein [Deltaproteobacteria bacterium]
MKITVRPVGVVRRFAEDQTIVVRAGLNSRGLIRKLGIPHELKMISFVNGTRVDLNEELKDGDEVRLVTLLTGG